MNPIFYSIETLLMDQAASHPCIYALTAAAVLATLISDENNQ